MRTHNSPAKLARATAAWTITYDSAGEDRVKQQCAQLLRLEGRSITAETGSKCIGYVLALKLQSGASGRGKERSLIMWAYNQNSLSGCRACKTTVPITTRHSLKTGKWRKATYAWAQLT